MGTAPTPTKRDSAEPSRRQAATVAVKTLRTDLRLGDGRWAGVAVSGWGVPLVVIHGLGAEGILYAETTSRLVSMGFKVIAIDTPGHGRSSALPMLSATIADSVDFVGAAMDQLGIGPCLVLGHSMGGRIAAQLAIARPGQIAGLVVVDAIVGRSWDRTVRKIRCVPGAAVVLAGRFGVDLVTTRGVRPSTEQLGVVARSIAQTAVRQIRNPACLVGPALAILRSRSSTAVIAGLAGVTTTVVIHGDRDGLVPIQTARDTQDAAHATLVVVEGAGHLWLLQDPEALPGIIGELLGGEIGDAYEDAVRRAGLDPATATLAAMEQACYDDGAAVLGLTPPVMWERGSPRRPPSYSWRTTRHEYSSSDLGK